MTAPFVLSFVGWSGSGKTTLLTRLLPELRSRGARVAVVKHSAHPHPLHKPGSDTDALEKAGASPVAFVTPEGISVTYPEDPVERLPELLRTLPADLVLIEGLKGGPYPKIEVWRRAVGPPLCASGLEVLAIVTDDPPPEGLRRFSTAELGGLALFILRQAGWPPA